MRWHHLLLGALLLLAGCARKAHIASGNIVFLGDSITAGYGLDTAQAYPALVHIPGMTCVNLGVSGNKTGDGLQRLKDYFAAGGEAPQLVVIELGANDFLRGVPHAETGENLASAVQDCKNHGVPVLLCGVRIPGKFGTDAIFQKVASDANVPLLPDILDDEARNSDLIQDDGHPNADGQKRIAEKMQAVLLKSFSFPKQ